jgi:hypothetical protein
LPEAKDLFYHGVRQQITRVLKAMGEDRISQGLTAFESGASTWSACFFARAYPDVNLNMGDPEAKIAELLGMPGNKVPMRIVYYTFDGIGFVMTKKGMQEFIRGFLDEQRDPKVQAGIDDLLKGLSFKGAEEKAIDFNECAVVNEKQPGWMGRDWSPEPSATDARD